MTYPNNIESLFAAVV